jgi:hypothetical protein
MCGRSSPEERGDTEIISGRIGYYGINYYFEQILVSVFR